MLSELERRSLADYLCEAYGIGRYESVGAAPMLWSGRETGLGVVDGMAVRADRVVSALRQRINASRQAIIGTEALLLIVGERSSGPDWQSSSLCREPLPGGRTTIPVRMTPRWIKIW